ncbi:MAG TPA: prepilin-type N-terminal cleavage/methylation domain-containing protein [Pirellulales bacterium]|nr:prepilin-type N-terminal cleavage/methylation domain-containing protein [Pirellulales bacterium]
MRIADCSNPKSKIQNPKSGITLLEVLISIFVLAVGLMGLASLLPVAKYYSIEASKYDRASTLAQGVFHDLQIRGYLLPKRWLDTSTFPSPNGPYGAYAVSTTNYPSTNLYSTAMNRAISPPVVIDPLAIGYAITMGQTPPPQFPAFLTPATIIQMTGAATVPVPSMPTLFRLTLDSARSWPNEDPIGPGGQLTMNYSLAQRLFRSNDDLIFFNPPDANLRPTAMFTAGGAPVATPDYQGDFSWFLTVAPDLDDQWGTLNATGKYILNAENMDRFTVSVVVLYKRDLNLDQNPNPATTTLDLKVAPPERMVYADLLDASAQTNSGAPYGINYAGGAVRLRTPIPNATTVPPVYKHWLDVKPNEWLMLSAVMNASTNPLFDQTGNATPLVTPSGLPVQVCQWYRIAGVGDTVLNPIDGSWYRDVQLAGPDWNNGFYVRQYYPTPPVPSSTQFVYATLVTGAIAVYDYPITLDESLLKD